MTYFMVNFTFHLVMGPTVKATNAPNTISSYFLSSVLLHLVTDQSLRNMQRRNVSVSKTHVYEIVIAVNVLLCHTGWSSTFKTLRSSILVALEMNPGLCSRT